MYIKKKRQVVIIVVFTVAMLLTLAMSISDLKLEVPGGLTNIFFCIYIPSFYVTTLVRQFTESYILLYSVFWITYIVTYLLLGWIIARLAYPNKKSSPEPDK